jgi:hypothetical protein
MVARETSGVTAVRNQLSFQPGRRAVDRLKPAPEPPGVWGRWGRWIPFAT